MGNQALCCHARATDNRKSTPHRVSHRKSARTVKGVPDEHCKQTGPERTSLGTLYAPSSSPTLEPLRQSDEPCSFEDFVKQNYKAYSSLDESPQAPFFDHRMSFNEQINNLTTVQEAKEEDCEDYENNQRYLSPARHFAPDGPE